MWKLNLMHIHISELWLGMYMVSVTGAHKWWILAPACICPIDGCWLPVKWIKHFHLAVLILSFLSYLSNSEAFALYNLCICRRLIVCVVLLLLIVFINS